MLFLTGQVEEKIPKAMAYGILIYLTRIVYYNVLARFLIFFWKLITWCS